MSRIVIHNHMPKARDAVGITQAHREAAAKKIAGTDPKAVATREQIVAGKADDHPTVQAAAFYANKSGTR